MLYTTALPCFPIKLYTLRDSNPGLLVPEADAMSTAPSLQGIETYHCHCVYLRKINASKKIINYNFN
jgi:hypothetical protein